MKHAASSLAILVAAFIIGCQENNAIVNTELNEEYSNQKNVGKSIHWDRLPIHATLVEPRGDVDPLLRIDGVVEYRITIVQRDPIPPSTQEAAILDLRFDACLRPLDLENPVWGVSGSSQNEVPLSGDTIVLLTKRYRVNGRQDGLTFRTTYRITGFGLEVERMWLELPRGDQVGTAN